MKNDNDPRCMFHLKLYPDNGEAFEVKAGARDVAVWERVNKFERVVSDLDGLAIADLYGIAHAAMTRQGLFKGKLAELLATHDLVLVDEDELDPTQPGASATG